ncbi:hypothetical protein Nepgr_008613 [Nepenthes gracilis]|uniref:LOB domain-containing protein n=1 Tax=Nepenthes gracilis TaxID=150966 RepID=A0AAD3S991_NEPGR|nr:hypothetical protein Nepgr_008613 [Nepenthes gracilis]
MSATLSFVQVHEPEEPKATTSCSFFLPGKLGFSISIGASDVLTALEKHHHNSFSLGQARTRCILGYINGIFQIFGASNVSKLLNEILPHQREDAVSSLAYEAEARLKDPVYGCVAAISVLQSQVVRLQKELEATNADLLRYSTSARNGAPSMLHHPPLPAPSAAASNQNVQLLGYRFDHHHHHDHDLQDQDPFYGKYGFPPPDSWNDDH